MPRPACWLLALTGAVLATAAPMSGTAAAAGSTCDQSVALLPRTAGATFVGLPSGPQAGTWPSGAAEVRAVAYSPDGTRAYMGTQNPSLPGGGDLVEVDVATRATLRTLALPASASALRVSPDGATAYVALVEPTSQV